LPGEKGVTELSATPFLLGASKNITASGEYDILRAVCFAFYQLLIDEDRYVF